MLDTLRASVPGEEFDYLALLNALKDYDRPRDKITSLLKKGVIRRIKKGIYVFGDQLSRRPYSREVLANMIYGPSYISLDSALEFHGLIPEHVEAVTSITCGRARRFLTPAGLFLYINAPIRAYAIGFDQVELDGGRFFLMAVPEKALADKIRHERGAAIHTQAEMKSYLSNHLRIDLVRIAQMNPALLCEIADRYRSRAVRILSRLSEKLQESA